MPMKVDVNLEIKLRNEMLSMQNSGSGYMYFSCSLSYYKKYPDLVRELIAHTVMDSIAEVYENDNRN